MANTVIDKKLDYSFKPEDFAIEGELTVTITLREYRELLKNDATRKEQIDKAESKAYQNRCENATLKEENTRLKSELYELKKACEVKVNVKAEENDEEVEY